MPRFKTPKTGKYHVPTPTIKTDALTRDITKDIVALVKTYTDEGVPRSDVYDIIHDLSRFD